MRLFFRVLILGLAAGGAGWGWLAYQDRDLPHFDGRSVRSWFWELCRQGSVPQRGFGAPKRELECRMAILRMGTNALPYLARQALAGGEDGAIRSLLHQASLRLPEWGGGSLCPPRIHVQGQAAWFFRPLRPSSGLVFALLESVANPTAPGQEELEAVLLGSVDNTDGPVMRSLLEHLTHASDPWVRAAAARSIRWLGARGLEAFGTVTKLLLRNPPDPVLIDWLAALGPAAEPAVRVLEPLLESTDDMVRFHAAVALVHIREHPEPHAGARNVLHETASPELPSTPVTRARTEHFFAALEGGSVRTNAWIGKLLEPLARLEARSWSLTSPSDRACRLLERFAPLRAAGIYRTLLDGPGAIPAAAGLLRIGPLDDDATRVLVHAVAGGGPDCETALLALSEAASSNTAALRCLAQAAIPEKHLDPGSRGRDSVSRTRARAAEYALVRIRYRELLEALGMDGRE